MRSSTTGTTGYNIYESTHGPIAWPTPCVAFFDNPPPEQRTGTWEQLGGGGNTVLAYLDLFAPDGNYEEVFGFVLSALAARQPFNPWRAWEGEYALQCWISPQLADTEEQIKELIRRALVP